MSYAGQTSIRIAPDDLRVVAQALMLRLPLRAAESRRLARMHQLLEVSSELGRAVGAQTHCGRVHCQGSYGAGDLIGDTETLASALVAYASLVHDVATEYRAIVDGSAPHFDRSADMSATAQYAAH
jgi:hypothetical protein